MLKLLFSLVVCFSYLVQPAAVYAAIETEPSSKPKIKLAILAYRDKQYTYNHWQPLLNYLQSELPETELLLEVYFHKELESAVEAKAVDFLFTHPSHYVLLTHRNGLSSPLASLVNKVNGTAIDKFGGVAFTKAERSDINDWTDFIGKRVGAIAITSTGAYQMQAFELLSSGVHPSRDIEVIELGQPQKHAVDAVLRGEVDVGFVRTGILEALSKEGYLDLRKIKVINASSNPDFPLILSTRLYPEWPFASMPHVDKTIARKMTAALLAIPHNGILASSLNITGFTIPGDYRVIDEMMRQLRVPPFDQNPYFDIQDVIQKWSIEITAIFAIVFAALLGFIILLLFRNQAVNRAKETVEKSLHQIRKLTIAIEQSPEGIMITDNQGVVEYINPAFEKISGYTLNELYGKNPTIVDSSQTTKHLRAKIRKTLSEGKKWRGELTSQRKSGAQYPSENIISPVIDTSGGATHYLTIHQDISDQKNNQQRIHSLMYFDPLTGLPNRTHLIDTMNKFITQETEYGVVAGLMLINIDHFKLVNEIQGASSGDQLLKAMAVRILRFVKDKGFVAKTGNDEFAVFWFREAETLDCEMCLMGLSESLLRDIEKPFNINGEQLLITCSLGAALVERAETKQVAEDILNHAISHANTALKSAKASGGHISKLFNLDMLNNAKQQHKIEIELRHAIKNQQLSLYIQPQVNLSGNIKGAETLIRWFHPDKGLISPGEFIPVAEKTNLIVELGHWVLSHACEILHQTHTKGLHIPFSVNISPKHFRQESFLNEVKSLLTTYQIPPKSLILEITEGLFLENLDSVAEKMLELHKLGVEFSIDDFGTGYSSLSYLRRLPVDELKIDRSFIEMLNHEELNGSLVETIYTVAKKMKLRIIAEGVETSHQVEILSRLDGLILQGYYFSKPEPSNEFLKRWIEIPST